MSNWWHWLFKVVSSHLLLSHSTWRGQLLHQVKSLKIWIPFLPASHLLTSGTRGNPRFNDNLQFEGQCFTSYLHSAVTAPCKLLHFPETHQPQALALPV